MGALLLRRSHPVLLGDGLSGLYLHSLIGLAAAGATLGLPALIRELVLAISENYRGLGDSLAHIKDGALDARWHEDAPGAFRAVQAAFNRGMDQIEDSVGRMAESSQHVLHAAVSLERASQVRQSAVLVREDTLSRISDKLSSMAIGAVDVAARAQGAQKQADTLARIDLELVDLGAIATQDVDTSRASADTVVRLRELEDDSLDGAWARARYAKVALAQ